MNKSKNSKTFVLLMLDSDKSEKLTIDDLKDPKRNVKATSFFIQNIKDSWNNEPGLIADLSGDALLQLIEDELDK